ncbi:hypothetical protein M885DRAFT_522870 [Pelagophyceae sp. CCMP2097]|nr:hypothetical protein M885DRAFT_522870 [Pelagophyceae sp. CCMP2097]|mmetsp:Transcript_27236/g.91552  ORF Transcript_27236/g.91552 Transcript_27236/m.91552 type:complete len:613 (+) Transcript_27236:257-2095(+)
MPPYAAVAVMAQPAFAAAESDGAARLRKLRRTVKSALASEISATAVWYADKLVTLSAGAVEDVLLLARAFHAAGEYARAAHALESRKVYGGPGPVPQFERGQTAETAPASLRARALAARCLSKCGRHQECVAVLEPALRSLELACDIHAPPQEASVECGGEVDVAAAACCLVGVAYEALEKRGRAVPWLRRALRVDARCAEAVAFLVDRRLLDAAAEAGLHDELEAALPGDDSWVAAVYGARLRVRDVDVDVEKRFQKLENEHALGDNGDVLCARAEQAYYAHDCRGAYALAQRARAADPFDLAVVPVYLACMVELRLTHDLFSCAHELVKSYPREPSSWFAVGCYYLAVGKNDAAQRYFHKSAKLGPRFAPAWVGFGNAFAAQDESEQAMAAYRSASRLFPGSHVPLLFIGLEYLRTNNLPLAKHFLRGARRLCATDPMVANELGVVELRQGSYAAAVEAFSVVLDLFKTLPDRSPLRGACEASVFNLAQTYRKMRDFDNAQKYFELALSLRPRDAAVRAALGATYHAIGGVSLHRAVEMYHTALAIRPDDTFCSEMLSRALRDAVDVDEPAGCFPFDRPLNTNGLDYGDDAADDACRSLKSLTCDMDANM